MCWNGNRLLYLSMDVSHPLCVCVHTYVDTSGCVTVTGRVLPPKHNSKSKALPLAVRNEWRMQPLAWLNNERKNKKKKKIIDTMHVHVHKEQCSTFSVVDGTCMWLLPVPFGTPACHFNCIFNRNLFTLIRYMVEELWTADVETHLYDVGKENKLPKLCNKKKKKWTTTTRQSKLDED